MTSAASSPNSPANHDSSNLLYQDLISAVPEPGSLVLASIGMVGGLGFYVRRARKSPAPVA